MPISEELNHEIDRSSRMLAILWKYFPVELERSDKIEVVGALATLCLEHIDSIQKLVATGENHGSACALARPVVDSMARALWILTCASEEQINQIRKDEPPFPAFKTMLQEVDDATEGKGMFTLAIPSVNGLHDLTHGGTRQIAARFDKDGNIAPNYTDHQMCGILRATVNTGTGMMFILSTLGIADQGIRERRTLEFQKEFLEIYDGIPLIELPTS